MRFEVVVRGQVSASQLPLEFVDLDVIGDSLELEVP
jgi:hypothetical protein